ncbi:unnamed protein product [Parascedosporium putredinis]|uniref:Uncharacterized protein n=1 Tax=Parascedosporium putredinis TaxID=1442378 RepID=A0A9P1M5K9_9PEZI|nr:unnamed protein product [Parascedosporium putredinis]CAI7988179.1 unnamed protein product [Parascedosporium putredinis]
MQLPILALGLVAAVYATEEAVAADFPVIDGEYGFAHPKHSVPIDDCDEVDHDDWHFRPCKKDHGHKPKPFPPQKWTTSTDTITKTKTVIECEDDVKECPEHPKTKYTTTTVEVTTTVCPVPDTDAPEPTPTAPAEEEDDDAEEGEKPPRLPLPVVISGANKAAGGFFGAVVALVAALI